MEEKSFTAMIDEYESLVDAEIALVEATDAAKSRLVSHRGTRQKLALKINELLASIGQWVVRGDRVYYAGASTDVYSSQFVVALDLDAPKPKPDSTDASDAFLSQIARDFSPPRIVEVKAGDGLTDAVFGGSHYVTTDEGEPD